MVLIDKITQKFVQLEEYIDILKSISKKPLNDFLKDKILVGSAKYYLQVSIEICLDVANHIISSERYRPPKDYADSFKVIEEEKIIASELGTQLRQMVKFRNRLVHLYGDIDDAYVYRFISDGLKDLEDFKKLIMKKYTQVKGP